MQYGAEPVLYSAVLYSAVGASMAGYSAMQRPSAMQAATMWRCVAQQLANAMCVRVVDVVGTRACCTLFAANWVFPVTLNSHLHTRACSLFVQMSQPVHQSTTIPSSFTGGWRTLVKAWTSATLLTPPS